VDYLGAGNRFTRDRLGRWIDLERGRIHQLEADLSGQTERLRLMNAELERQKRKVEGYEALATGGSLPDGVYDDYQADLQRYHALVDEFNAIVSPYKVDMARYKEALKAINDSIDRYNRMR
jgi:multidrug resistance efflux pump